MATFLAYLDPGDEVVVFEPFYPFMLGAVRQAGAVPASYLRAPDFAIDEAALRAAAASPRAKMLVLNSPHNRRAHRDGGGAAAGRRRASSTTSRAERRGLRALRLPSVGRIHR